MHTKLTPALHTDVEFLHLMQKGTELTEVKKTQPRTYHLDDDLLGVTVTWKSTVLRKTKEDKSECHSYMDADFVSQLWRNFSPKLRDKIRNGEPGFEANVHVAP